MSNKKAVIAITFGLVAAVAISTMIIQATGAYNNNKLEIEERDNQNINLVKDDEKYEEKVIKDKEEIKEEADFKLKEPKFIPEGFEETDSSLLENGLNGKFDKIYAKQFKDKDGKKSIQIIQKK